jgi:hypothetical protein
MDFNLVFGRTNYTTGGTSLININNKEKTMSSELLDSETESMLSIAENIEELSSHLHQEDRLDVKTALSCVKLYKSTFGDEGFSFLDNKVNSLMTKYGFKKPDETGIQEIKNFTAKLETLKTYQFHNYRDKKNYNSFIESEKKEISMSDNAIQKINEHFEKNSTIDSNGTLRVTGLNELNRKLNEGKPFILDIIEFYDTHDRLPTKEEISKLPKQGEETDRRSVKNINSKENLMSEVFEDREEETIAEEKELSPKQQAFIKAAREAAYDRKTVANAIRAGTLACLPGTDGYADTAPALNIMNIDNKYYHGAKLLLIKEHQKQNGFPTGEYLTAFQIDKAKEEKPDLFIRKGQHGITIHVNEKNDQTGDWDEKDIKLFNVAQLNKPAVIKEWAEQKRQEKEQEILEYNQTQYGTGYKPPEPKSREPGPEIVCSSTEPEKYLGQYLAAVSMGGKFKVTPEQAGEFSDKMIASLYKKLEPLFNKETGEVKQPPLNKEGEIITDSFSFIKISAAANQECKTFMRDLRIEAQKQNQPEQKQEQEQTQSLGRGM